MNPTLHHEILKARICDLHHQAQRDALALAARRARRARRDQSKHPAPALSIVARRILTVLGVRSTRPAIATEATRGRHPVAGR